MVKYVIRLTIVAILSSFTILALLRMALLGTNDSRHAIARPMIYVITPTYDRVVQKAELTRLSNTLRLVQDLHWIIVEDNEHRTQLVIKFVEKLKKNHKFDLVTHLRAQTPTKFKVKPRDPSWKFPRGVWQRNEALKWLRRNTKSLDMNGIVYFADDDNAYDAELFEEMRSTKLVSVWPVAFSGGLLVERPVVNPKTKKVTSFNAMWRPERDFPIDMAGFAVSLRLLVEKGNVSFSSNSLVGYQETDFLKQLVTIELLEPKANDCKQILVWHTKTAKPNLHEEKKLTVSSRSGILW